MLIDKDTVVSLAYKILSVPLEGEGNAVVVEERTKDEPLEFLYGQQILHPDVEKAIFHQSKGFKTLVRVQSTEAFGAYREDLRIWIDKSKFPKDLELKMGMKFQTQGPSGQVMSVIVKEIQNEKVLVDGNHPLAGLDLEFDLQVLGVRAAREEEILKKEVIPQFYH